MRLATVRKPAYTFPGGEPRIKETIASRAILIFWKEPRMCIFLCEISWRVLAVGNRNTSPYARICENDASAAGVFYGKFGLAVLTSDATLKIKGVSATCRPSYSRGGYVPMALERWSPWRVFTSFISNESR
jgi:hypothetical protein